MSNIIMTPGVVDQIDLRTIVDLRKLQQIQDDFAADTGLAMITVDSTGIPVTEASQFTALCRFLRSDPQIRRRCLSCDAHGGLQSAIEGRPVVYQCHAGLVDFSVSITWGTQYLGAVLCGQVLLKGDQSGFAQMMGKAGAAFNLFDEVRVVEFDRLRQAANEIVGMANEFLGSDVAELDRAAANTYLGRLPTFIDPVSNDLVAPLLVGPRKVLPLIPMELARPGLPQATEIVRNIRNSDLAANIELTNIFLDELFLGWSMKVRRAELVGYEDLLIGVAISEAVHLGRDISQTVIQHRNRRRTPMNRYECQLYCERLLVQLHNLLEPMVCSGEPTISSLINEMEKDPTSFLTLGKAASYLMMSPSHLARKFKEHTGRNFVNYVTEKRLERAKLMLEHTNKPVLRIAAELDFQPPNYFCRTFKKHTGLTPGEYRRVHTVMRDD